MKTYILTIKLKVTDESIQEARKWEKRKNLEYRNDISHLLFDCITDGKNIFEIEETEIDDGKEDKKDKGFIPSCSPTCYF